MALSPMPAGTTPDSPHDYNRSWDPQAGHPSGEVIGFPYTRRVATAKGLAPVHYTFRPGIRFRPLRTPDHPDALGISYQTSTVKAQEGFTPPRHSGLPGVRDPKGGRFPSPLCPPYPPYGRVITSRK
jgi:hypothetical protein